MEAGEGGGCAGFFLPTGLGRAPEDGFPLCCPSTDFRGASAAELGRQEEE